MLIAIETESLRAKSDFILASLRSLFDEPFEYYVDWSVLRAFNGAVIVDRESTLQVMFFLPCNSGRCKGEFKETLSDMAVSGYCTGESKIPRTPPSFINAIALAEREWLEMDRMTDTAAPARVKRLHIRTGPSAGYLDAKGNFARLVAGLGDALRGRVLCQPEYFQDWIAPDIDDGTRQMIRSSVVWEAEIVLEQGLTAETVRASVESLLPGISADLFGNGQFVACDSVTATQGMTWCHVYARYF